MNKRIAVGLVMITALGLGGCIDTSLDPLNPSPHDTYYMTPGIDDHEYPQCFYELEYAHGDAAYCDDGCCWWEFKSCGVMYCNDHLDECEWKKDFDSCAYEPR